MEVRPDIVVEWHDNLAIERFCSAQYIRRGHFIGHSAWVLTVRQQRHINLVIVTVFRIVV
ncbi:Uncharacterised protein [Vibrio cholerae]|nr:Uncharacterised protein [Vibrio cholerae]CSD16055.1 Uncharacterised protein [Vibrio cholerae]CSI55319.1 Uncharacterised protein [Vibrio cholerae]